MPNFDWIEAKKGFRILPMTKQMDRHTSVTIVDVFVDVGIILESSCLFVFDVVSLLM